MEDFAARLDRYNEETIQELAEAYGQTYYHKAWDKLEPEQRLGLRVRARRYLGM